jgi:hypothetical protein
VWENTKRWVETQQSQEKENYKNWRRAYNVISPYEFANWHLFKLGSYPLMESGKKRPYGCSLAVISFGILEVSYTGFILAYCSLLLTQCDLGRTHHRHSQNCLTCLWIFLSHLIWASHSWTFNIILHSEKRWEQTKPLKQGWFLPTMTITMKTGYEVNIQDSMHSTVLFYCWVWTAWGNIESVSIILLKMFSW